MRTQNTALVPLFNRLELYPLLRAMNKNKTKSLQAGSSRTKIIITEKKKNKFRILLERREREQEMEKKKSGFICLSSAQGEEKKTFNQGGL